MTEHAVVIAGGGPTGLMLAGELALAGVDLAIVERRAGKDLAGSRAGGLHSRTIEVLDQRGIADRFVSQGQTFPVAGFSHISLDISDLPTRHNYVLGLRQDRFEEILAGWVGELAVPIYRGREVTGFGQDDTGVDVEISDAESLRAEYLVGCDGGRSLVRKTAGIEFPGWDPTISSLVAEVEMRAEPEVGIRRDEKGTQAIGRLEDGERFRVVVSEHHGGQTGQPSLRDLSGARRRLGNGLRRAQPDLDLLLHGYDPSGGVLQGRTCAACGRRRARALPGGRAGPPGRRAGRGEPGLEAGPGSPADVAGKPAGHLPSRASPGRRSRPAEHDGADCAHSLRRAYRRRTGHDVRAAEHGRAAQAVRRARCAAGATRPRRARRPGHRSVGTGSR